MYVRLYDIAVAVKPTPGYSKAVLREAIIDTLSARFHVLTGGPDGTGYPFVAALHHADLVAAVMSVPGVARVEGLDAMVDATTPEGANVEMAWRVERVVPVRITNCPDPDVPTDTDRILLLGDEMVFVDPGSLLVNLVGAP
jgi:hypothetical protein